ncbi:alpha/beta hydrolase [Microbacterium aurantiacum]|uniref:alpha/beta hydrolase n=1 Tax=Microbacterium aurantiacum TaxID=162393 RepID=UPI001F1A98F7|nr:alpha/beta hydrolase [Microbacterium aurantiacum]
MTESTAIDRATELQITDATFDGPHGTVPIRIYQVPGTEPRSGLLWLHGGAFMFGDLEMPESHWVAQQLADGDRIVVAADYRLAPIPETLAAHVPPRPGHHFPVASEELTALFEALVSTDLAATTTDWAVGGASAGGNLAAGVAMRLRDEERATALGLLLVYPLLHAELPAFRPELAAKVAQLPEASQSGPAAVADLNLHYVGGNAEALSSPYAFAGGHDLEGLPSTFVLNSDSDSLRASGEAFAAELAAAGVDVQVINERGTVHGHINGPDNYGADRSITRIHRWLRDIEHDLRDSING